MDVTSGVPLPSLFPPATPGGGYHPHHHHQQHPSSGVFPPLAAVANPHNLLRAIGQLSWLSSKAGLITCFSPVKATVSFQLKDFCDSVGVLTWRLVHE